MDSLNNSTGWVSNSIVRWKYLKVSFLDAKIEPKTCVGRVVRVVIRNRRFSYYSHTHKQYKSVRQRVDPTTFKLEDDDERMTIVDICKHRVSQFFTSFSIPTIAWCCCWWWWWSFCWLEPCCRHNCQDRPESIKMRHSSSRSPGTVWQRQVLTEWVWFVQAYVYFCFCLSALRQTRFTTTYNYYSHLSFLAEIFRE